MVLPWCIIYCYVWPIITATTWGFASLWQNDVIWYKMSSCSNNKLKLHPILEFYEIFWMYIINIMVLTLFAFIYFLIIPCYQWLYINFLYILIFNNHSYFSIIIKELLFSLKLIIYLNTLIFYVYPFLYHLTRWSFEFLKYVILI